MSPRIMLARLTMLLAVACGVIAVTVGFADKEWKLGVTGWFEGGALLAILSVVMLADEYFERRSGTG
ncbi:MAG: hypothetical protein IH956_04650 [Chloroflexi bacterium]|nr:hypothetical protein [Chloroflexota bacterium]